MGGRGSSAGAVKLPGTEVYSNGSYKVQKVGYSSVSRGRHGGTSMSRKTGYELYSSKGVRVEKDSNGMYIAGYRYPTKKAAVAEADSLKRK